MEKKAMVVRSFTSQTMIIRKSTYLRLYIGDVVAATFQLGQTVQGLPVTREVESQREEHADTYRSQISIPQKILTIITIRIR